MNPNRRFVFDTNVLVSAFLFRQGSPRDALNLAMSIGTILHSEETLSELWEVLVRPKFDRFLSLQERITLIQGFERISQYTPVTDQISLCRDPKDDKFLNLAITGKAECITTGDQDLLVLADSFSISILSPTQFLAQKQPTPYSIDHPKKE